MRKGKRKPSKKDEGRKVLKRPYSEGERDVERGQDYKAYDSKPNDWRWYAQNEQLLRDSASFSYNNPVGMRLALGKQAVDVNKGSIPGIMCIYTAPSFGYSDNANSPINIAARNIYSFVRHANSGARNYDAVDEMMYLMAMDSVYSYIEWMKRVYGTVLTYSYTNRYVPVALVKSMGVSFEDIQRNLVDFRGYINTLSVKAGSLCIPASMSYMAKHMWMYKGVYADAGHDKAQLYLFNPDGFFQLNPSADPDGATTLIYKKLMPQFGNLKPQPVELVEDPAPVTLLTFKDLVAYGNSLIDPIVSNEDMNIMSGDILKAFDASNLYMVEMIPENYTVLAAYDMEVLDQIQNLTLIGTYAGNPMLKQDANKAYLEFKPEFSFPYQFSQPGATPPGYNYYFADKFINFQHGDVQPANTMEATRMTNIADHFDDDTYNVIFKTIASEVAMYAHIYYYSDWNGVWALTRSRTVYGSNTAVIEYDSEDALIPTKAQVAWLVKDYKAGGGDAIGSPTTNGSVQLPFSNVNPAVVVSEIMNAVLLANQLSNFDRHPQMSVTMGILGNALKLQNLTLRLNLNIDTTGTTLLQFGYIGSNPAIDPPITEWYDLTPMYGRYNGVLSDISYYTTVNAENLVNMAQTALLSMFNVTQYGRKA